MKIYNFWAITPCSPVKVNRTFGGTSCLLLQTRRVSQVSRTWSRKQDESWRWRQYIPPERRLTALCLRRQNSTQSVYWLAMAGLRGFDSRQRKKLFLCKTTSRLILATHSASHPRGPRNLFLDVKWPEHETHNSPLLNLVFKVKNMCSDFSLRRRTTPLWRSALTVYTTVIVK
jgi:hypothetical protein